VLLLAAGCINFPNELDTKLNELDAGTPDAGAPDAGCGQEWCLVSRTVIGDVVTSVIPDGHGHFLAIAAKGPVQSTAQTWFVYADGGAYSAALTPNILTIEGDTPGIHVPSSIRWRNDYVAVADPTSAMAIVNMRDGTAIGTEKCGEGDYQVCRDVAWVDDQTAAFACTGYNASASRVCRLSFDGGVLATDYSTASDSDLYAIAVLPSGDLFLGDRAGRVLTVPAGQSTPYYWVDAKENENVASIAGTDLSNVWVVFGGYNDIARFDNPDAGWTNLVPPNGSSADYTYEYSRLFVTSPTELWLGDWIGNVFHYVSGAWSAPITFEGLDNSSFITSVAAVGANDLAVALNEKLGNGNTEGRLLVYHRQ
jgi:hypothetical protein